MNTPISRPRTAARRRCARILLALPLAAALAACTPAGPRALLDGEALLKQGRPAEAVERLRRATELLPGHAQAWNHLGLAYHRAGRVAEARSAYLRAQQLDPRLPAAYHNLGALLLEQGDAANAIYPFSSLVGLNPRDAEAWLMLGTAQLRARQPERAEQSFRRVLELAPAHAVALNELGWIEAQRRRPREAAQLFRTALEAQPGYAPAWLNYAVVSAQLNQRPEAQVAARRFAALRPDSAEAAALLALAAEIERQTAAQVAAASNTAVFNLPGGRVAVVTNILPPAAPAPAASPAVAAGQSLRPPAATNPPAVTTPPAVAARPAPATNQPTAAAPLRQTSPTPAPPPAATPTVLTARPAVPTNQTATAAAPAVLPAPPAATPQTELVREVVELAEEPVVVASRFVPTGSPPAAPAATNRPLVRPYLEQGRGDARPGEPEKPGFFQRLNPARWDAAKLNPVRWFGDGDKEATVEPVPARTVAPATSPAQVARTTPPATAAVAAPPPAAAARYTYQSPPRPEPGDRAAAQAQFAEGLAAQRAGRPAEALQHYQEAARLDPAFFDVHYNAALAALSLASLPAALSASELALAVQPDSVEARYNFALALERAGHPVDAAVELEKLVQQQPRAVNAHLLLGNLYAGPLGRPADARAHYRRVLELAPNHPQAATIRGWLAANP